MKIAIGFSQPTPLSDTTRADNAAIKKEVSLRAVLILSAGRKPPAVER